MRTKISEEELRALLAIEGLDLRVTVTETNGVPDRGYSYLAMVISLKTMQHVRYAVGKTYNQAIKAIIKAYYADT